jgi:hypothetical protein
MTDSAILPVNFTISDEAKVEIENLRRFQEAHSLDPPAVAVIAWGLFTSNAGQRWESVVVGFYGKSELPAVAHGIQEVSGLPLIFFTTAEYHPKFEGKLIDHAAERGFFLRDP